MTNRIGPMDQVLAGKIGNKVGDANSSAAVDSSNPGANKVSPGADGSGDTVNLTSNAKLLERLDKAIQSLPAIDAERVAEVKAAIQSGDFEIDADAIADAMVRLDRSFGD